jgi:NAD+ kinase
VKVGLVVHSGREPSLAAATEAARSLADLDVEVQVARAADPADDGAHSLEQLAPTVHPDGFADDLDLAVSFGGDGTFLRAAHLCRDAQVPVLGVNLGRLGFLAEVELDDLGPALRAVASGEFTVEHRPTLQVTVEDRAGATISTGWALNEVSIEKSARHRLLLMDVHVDGTLFAKVPADALILATATGSTAYALSAGGPIVSPRIEATLVVPVAPHTLFDRSVLAAPDEAVRVNLPEDQEPALVSCDGRSPLEVEAGGAVTVVGGGDPVRLVRVGLLDFTTLVRRKFGLR